LERPQLAGTEEHQRAVATGRLAVLPGADEPPRIRRRDAPLLEAPQRAPEDVEYVLSLVLGGEGFDWSEEALHLRGRARRQIDAQDPRVVPAERERAPVLAAYAQELPQVPVEAL